MYCSKQRERASWNPRICSGRRQYNVRLLETAREPGELAHCYLYSPPNMMSQGGAAHAPDTYRGYINEGGLWAERIGAHLPGFPDQSWASGSPLSGVSKAGINFYRTTFELPVSSAIDAPVRLSVTRSNATTVSNFRLQIYLNGWQVGKYVNSIGWAHNHNSLCMSSQNS